MQDCKNTGALSASLRILQAPENLESSVKHDRYVPCNSNLLNPVSLTPMGMLCRCEKQTVAYCVRRVLYPHFQLALDVTYHKKLSLPVTIAAKVISHEELEDIANWDPKRSRHRVRLYHIPHSMHIHCIPTLCHIMQHCALAAGRMVCPWS